MTTILEDLPVNEADLLALVVLVDGSAPLQADWDAGAFQVRAETIYADVATGTAPLIVNSTTVVSNLNADMVDGLHGADLLTVGTQRLKERCLVATTADITLAGDQTIDGVNLTTGDRVLVRAQSDPIENGIYVVDEGSAAPWTRATDLAAGDSAAASIVVVTEGTQYSDSLWLCTDDDGSDVVDTDALTFRPISSPGGIPELDNADGATITFDIDRGYSHKVTLDGNRTLALDNVRVGDRFRIKLTQDAVTGSRTVTWFTTINWLDGSEPTLLTATSASDVFEFVCTSAGNYDGWQLGTAGGGGSSPPFEENDWLVQDLPSGSRARIEVTTGLPTAADALIVPTAIGASSAIQFKIYRTNVFTTAPGVTNDEVEGYNPGSQIWDKTNFQFYICSDSTAAAAVWNKITAPFDDANTLIHDTADATKLLRIDVGAITTATTRVLTMPDRDVDLSAAGSAYTQTYSTADRTIGAYTPDDESSAYSGIDNAQGGTPYAQLSDLNALRTAYENQRAFVEDAVQLLNAAIDDLQAIGLLT